MKYCEEIYSCSEASTESLDSIQIIDENCCTAKSSHVTKFDPSQPFSYKVRDFQNSWVHSFSHYPTEGIVKMNQIIDTSLLHNPVLMDRYGMNYQISYWDSASDLVSLQTDNDIYECIRDHQRVQKDVAMLVIHCAWERDRIVGQKKQNDTISVCIFAALCLFLSFGAWLDSGN